MDVFKTLQKNGFEFAMAGLGVVVVVVMVQGSGGVAELGRTLFNGLNATYATLLDRSSRSI